MLLSIHGLPSTGKVRAAVLSLLCVCLLADLLQGGSGNVRGRGRSSEECYLNISNTLPVWQPVVITRGGLVVPQAPTNWSAAITLDGRAILACPGKRNKMALSRGNNMNVTCRGGDQLEMDGKVYPARDLGCTKATQGKALDTEERCADHATILQLGFEVGDDWYPMVDICHDLEMSSSLYSQHMLYGSGLSRHDKIQPGHNSFEAGDNYVGFSPSQVYKKVNVLATLTRILGSKKQAEKFTSKTFLARGHLSPRADFTLQAYQNLTFFYVNTVPEWQSVNAGNLASMENSVRHYATDHRVDLQITTGTHDTLTLPNQDGRPKPIFLHLEGKTPRIQVPKLLWKTVYNPRTKAAIAFVVVNNPFLKTLEDDYVICQDVCREYGWGTEAWRNISKGYIYCCEVRDLREVVDYLPYFEVITVLLNK